FEKVHRLSNMHQIKIPYHLVAKAFVEGNCRYDSIAGGIGHIYHVEIALQLAVFARRTVNGYKYSFKVYFLPLYVYRKVVFIHLDALAAMLMIPAVSCDDYLKYLIFGFIQVLFYCLGRA